MTKHGPKTPWWTFGIGAVLLLTLLAVGTLPRIRKAEAVERQHQLAASPRVVVTGVVQKTGPRKHFTLPGNAAPLKSTTIYARSTGFVRALNVDLGDQVKAGQVVAELEAPELDEDVRRSRARLEEAEANVLLAQSASARAQRLAEQGVSSKQQAEEALSRKTTAEASVMTAKADAVRFAALKGFTRVLAPFSGVITKRFVEGGGLVASAQAPLFELAQVNALRVTVDVPQWLATEVLPGTPVKIDTVQGLPTPVAATVTRTSGALDSNTRVLRAEIAVSPAESLMANGYVRVTFELERPSTTVTIPASALSVGGDGARVVEVRDNKAQLTPVVIAQDLGRTIELAKGPPAGALVVLNPPDDLGQGEPVTLSNTQVIDGGQAK
jgi:RND family efflux transporter MFP subunit